MPSPTFVSEVETSWASASSPQSVATSVASGDLLVVCALGESSGMGFGTPSGGGLTYTQWQLVVNASFPEAGLWTAPGGSGSFSIAETATGAFDWGLAAVRFANAKAGAVGSTTGTTGTLPSLTFTTTQDNSAIVFYATDWNANDPTGSGLTYDTGTAGAFTELTRVFVSGHQTVYGGYYADSGLAGSKTVGLTAGSASMNWSIVVAEVPYQAAPPPPAQAGPRFWAPMWRGQRSR